jgi:3',5'-cyclic AMP phosphodiesterase CpdA
VSRLRSVAALYDIHGNLPALDAVLDELRSQPPDAVVIGGDVAAGPMPLEVLARLRELPWPVHWLRGNADRAVVMGFDGTIPAELRDHPLFRGDAWAATFLSRHDRDFLDALPPLLALGVDSLGEVLFCHGTAHSDEERVTGRAAGPRPDGGRRRGPGGPFFAPVDPDAVAERYERSGDEALADASLIDPAENPLARR